MLNLREPSADEISALLARCADVPFTYPEVGATRGELPSGYNIDRYEVELGRAADVFTRARDAIRGWRPFDLPWITVHANGPPTEGQVVAVVARVMGLWWINVSRVVYTVDEPDRFGFAYGTLPPHAERGEEIFEVTHDADTGIVRYVILAFSRPRHPLARLGYPLSRATQRRFGRQSGEAMRAAT